MYLFLILLGLILLSAARSSIFPDIDWSWIYEIDGFLWLGSLAGLFRGFRLLWTKFSKGSSNPQESCVSGNSVFGFADELVGDRGSNWRHIFVRAETRH